MSGARPFSSATIFSGRTVSATGSPDASPGRARRAQLAETGGIDAGGGAVDPMETTPSMKFDSPMNVGHEARRRFVIELGRAARTARCGPRS